MAIITPLVVPVRSQDKLYINEMQETCVLQRIGKEIEAEIVPNVDDGDIWAASEGEKLSASHV